MDHPLPKSDPPTAQSLQDLIVAHDARSHQRHQAVLSALDGVKAHGASYSGESNMTDTADHVHVHTGDGTGGMGHAAGLAALAMHGRDRDRESGMLPAAAAAMAAMAGNRDHGWGGALGAGALGFVAGAMVNGGGLGGFLGNRGGDAAAAELSTARIAFDTVAMQTLNSISAAIPTTALQTQNTVMQGVASLALGTQQGLANVKDAVQASNLGLFAAITNVNQNVLDQGSQTRTAVMASTQAILDRINQNTISELQAQLADQRHRGFARDSEINVTQTVNQVQAQAQAQQQQQQQFVLLSNIQSLLGGLVQVAHATNQNVIAGNTGAVTTGAQNANPVNVAT